MNSSSRVLKNLHNKSYKIKNIRRTHEECKELEEQEIPNKLIPDIYRNFIPKIFQSTFQSKWRQFVFKSRPHWCNTWIEYFSKDIESEDYSIVLESKYKELYLQIHQYKFTFVKHCRLFDFKTWDFMFTDTKKSLWWRHVWGCLATEIDLD